jgi:hypothetical protein
MEQTLNNLDNLSLFIGFLAGALAVGLVTLAVIIVRFIIHVYQYKRDRAIFLQTKTARQ